jgi:hypothetical protein
MAVFPFLFWPFEHTSPITAFNLPYVLALRVLVSTDKDRDREHLHPSIALTFEKKSEEQKTHGRWFSHFIPQSQRQTVMKLSNADFGDAGLRVVMRKGREE